MPEAAVREAARTAKPMLTRTATYLAESIEIIYGRYLAFSNKMKQIHTRKPPK